MDFQGALDTVYKSLEVVNALRPAEARNTMITMNDWLESTLKVEMQDEPAEAPAASSAASGLTGGK